jgi:hypothetical protein
LEGISIQYAEKEKEKTKGKRIKFDEKDLHSLVQQVQTTLYVKDMEDWYYIPKTHLIVIAKMERLINRSRSSPLHSPQLFYVHPLFFQKAVDATYQINPFPL